LLTIVYTAAPDAEAAASFATGSSRSNAIVVAPGDESVDIDVEDLDVDKILDVNSAIAVEKEIAADTMGTIFAATKNHFLPHVEPCVLALVELLPHYYEGIRKSATDSLLEFVQTFYELSAPQDWAPGMNIVSSHYRMGGLVL
jgi:importin-4